MLEMRTYKTQVHNDWCPGCGDFGLLASIQSAFLDLGLEQHQVVIFGGIGCSGKTPHLVNVTGFHTLHGRVLTQATGGKLVNDRMEVVAMGGDGDGLGIGVGHFIHAGRRNVDFAYIIFDNKVYGLTKGQSSPTLQKGLRTKSMSAPSILAEINPLALALSAGYTFVARSYSNDVKHTKEIIKKAITHRGAAFVDVLQPCPTYNNLQTKEWFAGDDRADGLGSRLYKLDEAGWDPVVRDPDSGEEILQKMTAAMVKSREWGDRIPLGVFYQVETATFEDHLRERMPVLKEKPVVDLPIHGREVRSLFDELA